MRRSVAWPIALVLAAGCGDDPVQPEPETGSLDVQVVVEGWSLPGVAVTVTGPGGTFNGTTGSVGRAGFDGLAVGSYSIALDDVDPDAVLGSVPTAAVFADELATAEIEGTFDPGRFVDVRIGSSFTCALNENGNAYCWGFGGNGELGNGGFAPSLHPQRVRAPVPLIQITAGLAHACGLAAGGTAYCWGTNQSGRLGRGATADELQRDALPARVEGTRFSVIDAGGSATCGVETPSGRAFCWGSSQWGFLGSPGGPSPLPRPVDTGTTFETLSANDAWAGDQAVAAITADGRVYFWGAVLENATSWMSFAGTEPTEIPVPSAAVRVTPACAWLDDGGIFCWPDLEREVPEPVLERLVETSEPGLHEYLIDDLDPVFFRAGLPCMKQGGAYSCLQDWGFELPPLSFGGETVTAVSTRGYRGCAVTDPGRVWCWGDVDYVARVRAGPGS